MIHYHGGVLHTDAIDWWEYAGRNFCVSYAYPEKVGLYHEIGQAVMLDNGAFSLWKDGKPTDWPAFYRWAEPWLRYQTTWSIIPDVMDGTEEDNDRLLDEWPFGKDKGAPVWHLPESMDRLARLVREWPLVCLGVSSNVFVACPSCGALANHHCHDGTPCLRRQDATRINGDAWQQRMADAMNVCCDAEGYPLTKLHLLRGLKFSGGPYPLYSADSASVARSWSGTPGTPHQHRPKQVAKFYANFDGKNPPPRWVRPAGVQESLFAAEDEPVLLTAEQLDEGGPLGDPHEHAGREAVAIVNKPSSQMQGRLLG